MERSNCREIRLVVGAPKTGDSKRSVEVLPDLGNYPISYSPGVNPGDVSNFVATLNEDGGPEGGNGVRDEAERVFVGGG